VVFLAIQSRWNYEADDKVTSAGLPWGTASDHLE